MWPLGQPHKLWLVPTISARGPPKEPLLSFNLISCLPQYCLTLLQLTEWHLKAPPNCLSVWHSLTPGIQSHLEWPLHLFHTSALESKAHCYYYLWLWLVNMYIYYYELFSCLCVQNRNWFCILICVQLICVQSIYCVQCIMYIAIVCIGAANKVEAIKVSNGELLYFYQCYAEHFKFAILSYECKTIHSQLQVSLALYRILAFAD